jgi:hypothetical protein
VKLTAIEPFTLNKSWRPGDVLTVPDDLSQTEADQLTRKGLAKMSATPRNKMAPAAENKADPTAAAGEARPSSASRAAQASPRTTASRSGNGAPRKAATKTATKKAATKRAPAKPRNSNPGE